MDEEELSELVDDDVAGGVFRIHARAFTDPAIFALEKKRIFDKTWIYAFHESELDKPGVFLSRRVAGRELLFTRDASGQVHAFVNACLHRGARVCREASGCNKKTFQCGYHGWSYDLQGKLVGLPGEDAYAGSTFDREGKRLKVVRLDSYRGLFFVNADDAAEPLSDYLGGVTEYLDAMLDQGLDAGMEVVPGSTRYAMRANWKLTAENGIDAYHFRVLHRRYVGFARSRQGAKTNDAPPLLTPVGRSFGNGHGGNEHDGIGSLGRLAGRWGPIFGEELRPLLDDTRRRLEEKYGFERALRLSQGNRNARLFPNTYLLDSHAVTIRTFFPTAVDHVEVTEWALAPKGESELLRRERMRLYSGMPGPGSFVSPDDVEVIEDCQRGLMSGLDWLDVSRGMKRTPALHTDELQQRALFRRWHELITQSRVRHPHET